MIVNDAINLKMKLGRYLKYWKWIVFSVIISLTIAYIYQRYVTRIYKATSTILINDYRRAGFNSEISAFTDKFSVYNQNRVSIDNEMEFIKSRENVRSAIEDLNLNISYYSDGNLKSQDLYDKSPIKFVIVDSLKNDLNSFLFEIEKQNDEKFQLFDSEKKTLGIFRYNVEFVADKLKFVVVKNDNFSFSKLSSIFVKVDPISNSVESFRNRIITTNPGEETSVCDIQFTDPSPNRAIDFVNSLVKAYEKSTILEKQKQIKNTYHFVNERLADVDNVLVNTESSDESYKRLNNIVNVDIESGITLSKREEFSSKINENNTTISLVNNVLTNIYNDKFDYMPSNIVPTNQILMGQMVKYNEDISDYNRFSEGTSQSHPDLIEKKKKLLAQKKSIIDGLGNFIKKLQQENDYYNKKFNLVLGKVGSLPNQEREVNRSQRKIGIISETYKYLMNKKEETAISLYSVAPNSKVIEKAFCTNVPIYPSKKIIYLVALVLGLFIPLVFIYCILLFDTKILGKKDVTDKLTLPYLGEISSSKDKILEAMSRTSASESFRIVRANLEYVIKTLPIESKSNCKKIFTTSTIPKEGKTFVGVNLAIAFSQVNKKVLLVGLDIRNPKFDEYLENIDTTLGLTNYLSQEEKPISDYIQFDAENRIDVLPSGMIPPNPTDVLLNFKIEKVFSDLEKEYDYIIVDTSPVSLVSDTILISNLADYFVFVLRYDYSEKRFLDDINDLQREGKIEKVCLLLNDVPINRGYGYGYGYGYGREKSSFVGKVINFMFKDKFNKNEY